MATEAKSGLGSPYNSDSVNIPYGPYGGGHSSGNPHNPDPIYGAPR